MIVLLAVGIKGCLDGRQEQALKDYNRDVSTIIQDANANADAFFDALTSGSAAPSTDLQSDVNQLRFSQQRLSKQAEDLDVPGDMRPAHRNLLLSLGLVQEAIGKVAQRLPAARSTDSAAAEPAVRAIAGEMQAFVSADVLYTRRAAAVIDEVLDGQGIGGQQIARSEFLQNLGWLQPSTVARRINADAAKGAGDGAASDPAPGLHGHGVLSVAVGDQALAPGAANRVPAGANLVFNVKIANQGDNPEADVKVSVRITGGGDPITVDKTVDQTTAKSEVVVAVPLGRSPPTGAVQIVVEVVPVNGEKNTTNNKQTYPAIFSRG